MDEILEIVKLILPSLVVLATTVFLVKKYLESTQRDQMLNLKQASQKEILPRRLQAYERLVLFLERISPNSLVMRVHKTGMSGKLLQSELLKAVRQEYEHNIAQQVYMSTESWNLVKSAKEETIQLINIAASKVNDNATGVDFAQKIFELSAMLDVMPTDNALNHLKKDIQRFF